MSVAELPTFQTAIGSRGALTSVDELGRALEVLTLLTSGTALGLDTKRYDGHGDEGPSFRYRTGIDSEENSPLPKHYLTEFLNANRSA